MKQIFINLLAFGSLLSSVLVITSKNPVIAVIFLISVFINAAGYLILLGIGFIGISYIIIYIGAITVLFLFVIMLLNIKISEIIETRTQYTKNLPLAIAIGSIFIYEFFTIIPFSFNDISIISYVLNIMSHFNQFIINSGTTPLDNYNIIFNSINPAIADITFAPFLQIESIGHMLYTLGYSWLIITSVILLLSMVAPIFISKTNQSINPHSPAIVNFNLAKSLSFNTNLPLHPNNITIITKTNMSQYKMLRTKIKHLHTNSILLNSNIHTSAVLNADRLPVINNLNRDPLNDNLAVVRADGVDIINDITGQERVQNLLLLEYKEKATDLQSSDLINPDYSTTFPWLVDDEGKMIVFNKPINLLDGVKLVSNYLEKRCQMDPNFISETKITEYMKIFEEAPHKNTTVLDLFNYFKEIYNKDKETFIKLNEPVKVESLENNYLNNVKDINTTSDQSLFDKSKICPNKPFGEIGDITLNEFTNKLYNLKFEYILDGAKFTWNVAPTVANLAGFGFVLRSYIKHVHNRPYNSNLNAVQKQMQINMRRKNLALFTLLGCPVVLWALQSTAISYKDQATIKIPIAIGNSKPLSVNNSIANQGLLENKESGLLLSSFNQKLPKWIKIFFKLLLFGIFILKLLGFNHFIDIFHSLIYLKIFFYVIFLLLIIYQLLNVFILSLFIKNTYKIPEILPEFLISWFQEFEILSSSSESIKEFKNMCYREIFVYVLIMVFMTLLF